MCQPFYESDCLKIGLGLETFSCKTRKKCQLKLWQALRRRFFLVQKTCSSKASLHLDSPKMKSERNKKKAEPMRACLQVFRTEAVPPQTPGVIHGPITKVFRITNILNSMSRFRCRLPDMDHITAYVKRNFGDKYAEFKIYGKWAQSKARKKMKGWSCFCASVWVCCARFLAALRKVLFNTGLVQRKKASFLDSGMLLFESYTLKKPNTIAKERDLQRPLLTRATIEWWGQT